MLQISVSGEAFQCEQFTFFLFSPCELGMLAFDNGYGREHHEASVGREQLLTYLIKIIDIVKHMNGCEKLLLNQKLIL